MQISYNKLWKKLIDLGWKKSDLAIKAGISSATLAKLSKGERVSMGVMEKICSSIGCDISEIVEFKE